jgi:hypothetical protein
VVKLQAANITFLPDNLKLQLPTGLFQTATSPDLDVFDDARRVFNTFRHISGVGGIDRGDRITYVRAGPDAGGNTFRESPSNWVTPVTPLAAGETIRCAVEIQVGDFDDAGAFVARTSVDMEAKALLRYVWGPNQEDELVVGIPVAAGTASPADAAAMVGLAEVEDQISDWVSIAFGLNYSVADWGWLTEDANRFQDAHCQVIHDVAFYTPQLSPYTLSCIAALNLAAVSGQTTCAWARAYGTAVGLLPHSNSLHHVEYQTTTFLPEETELKAVIEAHPVGVDGERLIRGCMSIIAAFGATHMGNDHTYKHNDDHLKRKAKAMVFACRTALKEKEVDELMSDTRLETTIRTTAHCFGLASTWSTFRDGQKAKFIAEPLQIRTSVVPPLVAKVGLVVSQLDKMFALPIGAMFRKAYGKVYDDLSTLRTTVVKDAPQYSALHKYYGYDARKDLTLIEDNLCESLLPIATAYALTFGEDEKGNPSGAALSQICAKCNTNSRGLVELYMAAFEAYVEKSTDLMKLIEAAVEASKKEENKLVVA